MRTDHFDSRRILSLQIDLLKYELDTSERLSCRADDSPAQAPVQRRGETYCLASALHDLKRQCRRVDHAQLIVKQRFERHATRLESGDGKAAVLCGDRLSHTCPGRRFYSYAD